MEDNINVECEARFCENCGAAVRSGARFCRHCGAKLYLDNDVAPQQPTAAPKTFCRQCGTELDETIKFCHKCGAPTNGSYVVPSQSAASPVAPVFEVDKAVTKRRIASGILYLAEACISIVVILALAFSPFMNVFVQIPSRHLEREFSQGGFGLISVMFSGESELTDITVSIKLLRWAGWFYFLLLFAIIDHAVCFIVNIFRYKKGERPINLIQSNILILIASVGLLVVGCMAQGQVRAWQSILNDGNISCTVDFGSLGFVGVFVSAVVGTAVVFAAYLVSIKAYPPYDKRARKTGGVLAMLIVDLVLGVVAGFMICVPVYNSFDRYNDYYSVRTAHINDTAPTQHSALVYEFDGAKVELRSNSEE